MNTQRLDELLGMGKPPKVPKEEKEPLIEEKETLRKSLKEKVHHRMASLTPAEEFFLHALLIDDNDTGREKSHSSVLTDQSDEQQVESLKRAHKRLDDDVLFSVPDALVEDSNPPPRPPRTSRRRLRCPSTAAAAAWASSSTWTTWRRAHRRRPRRKSPRCRCSST